MKDVSLDKVVIVIPSYLPPEKLVGQVASLQSLGFVNIVVVDDGSPARYRLIFDQLKNVILLSNQVNTGKGDALKLAYRFIITHFSHCGFAISCDDDGQHHPDDVLKVSLKALTSQLVTQEKVVFFGARAFDGKVPLKSRFGNFMIAKLVQWSTDKTIRDTQTGLRAIPLSLLPALVDMPYDTFNFEFASLLYFIKNKIAINEISIRTIYFDNNKITRFKGVQDSLKVLSTLVNFSFGEGKIVKMKKIRSIRSSRCL